MQNIVSFVFLSEARCCLIPSYMNNGLVVNSIQTFVARTTKATKILVNGGVVDNQNSAMQAESAHQKTSGLEIARRMVFDRFGKMVKQRELVFSMPIVHFCKSHSQFVIYSRNTAVYD